MAGQMQGALADLLRTIGRMQRRLDALQAVETDTAGGGGGSGTVTSVGLALPAILTVSGSPVTTAGTLTAVLATQAANRVWAGPTSGGAAAPTFRALVAADLPAGTGTVTSVALSLPAIFTVSGSPVTAAGTLTATLATQAANLVWAGPGTGADAAPTFRALVAADLPAGTGTVTSVALSLPAIFSVSGSPVTTAGTLTATLATQVANRVWAGPTTGADAAPTFRALVAADLPAGTGTVTSVALSLPAIFSVSGSPVTTAGTLTATLATQAANLVWAGPTTGAAAAPTFRALVAADMAASVAGTTSKLAKFTAANAVGDSIVTESGSKIQVSGSVEVIGQANTNQLIVKGYSTQTAAQIVIQSSAGTEWLSIRGLANGSVMIGKEAGPSITSSDSIAIGYRAMNGVTSSNSVAIGTQALEVMNTSGHSNIAIGYWAGKQITGGLYNVLIGEGAGYALTTGINNFMLGTNAGWNLTGSENICIGAFGMYYSTSAAYNTIIGSGAGVTVNGSRNTVIGYYAGYTGGGSAVSFSDSVYVGNKSGYGSNAGSYNTAVGSESLQKVVTGATAVGYQAGLVATGAGQVLVGYQAGVAVTTGTNNTIVGYQAGASLSTNGGCVMIGYQAGNAETAANKLYIHNSSSTTPLIYGDFSTPSLTFNGTITVQDARNISTGTTTGTIMATTTAQKLAFHGATAVIQRAGAAQAAVATTAATNTAPYGYTTAAQADAIVTLVNEIRATLVEKGIMKGAA